MVQATGKLMWGQAGEYDAVDDRQVISSTVQGAPGVLIPPTISPAGGLTVDLGRFVCAVACDDDTVAVAASTDTIALTVAAGPQSGSREDWVWLHADPDAGTWDLDVIPASTTGGLLGISLGQLIVPQGANLATQFTIWPTINQMGYIRNFYNDVDRRAFFANFPAAWGGGFGNLTSIAVDPSGNNPYHLDVANRQGTFDLLWSGNWPRFVQSGQVNALTNQFGDIYQIPFSIPFTATPVPQVVVTGIGAWWFTHIQQNPAWFSVKAYNPNGAVAANTAVTLSWVAVGRVITDTLPNP